jgi:hypothetical protein
MTNRRFGRGCGLSVRAILLAAALTIAAAVPASAQLEASFGGRQSLSSTAYYYISKAGEITMPVNLWGNVKNPGRYEVPISTDLVELLSFAGGPSGRATLDAVRIIRTVRRDNLMRKVEFEVNLDEMQKLDEKALDLEPGDTIIIEGGNMDFRDYALIISTVAAVTAAIASIVRVTQ